MDIKQLSAIMADRFSAVEHSNQLQ